MIIVFTVCDISYYNHFDTFAKSYIINENNKDKVKYVHFFIYKDKNDRKVINGKINETFKKFINFKFIKYKNKNISFRLFCCHFRFEAFKILFEEDNNNNIIIYSDVDAYINNSLYNKIDLLNDNAYFFLRNNKNFDNYVNINNIELTKIKSNISKRGVTYFLSGVIILKVNSKGKRILKRLISFYNKQNPIEWYSDQLVLDNIFWWAGTKISLKISILDRYYFDLNLKDENGLFLCKGNEFPLDRTEWKNLVKNINIKFNQKFIND